MGDDFNDVHREKGPEAIRLALENARVPDRPKANGARATQGAGNAAATVSFACAADVPPTSVEWLWQGRIARGKLTLIAGDPGIGKSQLTADLVARITAGDAWPDGGRTSRGSAIMLSAEDSIDDTIVPRLEAAGADLNKVHILRSVSEGGRRRTFSLAGDLEHLARQIDKVVDAAIVTIDPVTSYLGSIDSHRTSDVRAALEPLAEFADKHRIAVVAVSHPPKAAQSKAINSITGSLAFVAAARLAFIVAEEPDSDGRRLLLAVKNNLAPLAPGLGFRLVQRLVGEHRDIVASHVAFDKDPVTISADDAVRGDSDGRASSALAEAKEWLADRLAEGESPAREVETDAEAAGIPERTLRRARKALNIVASKTGFQGGWVWSPPAKAANEGGQDGPTL